MIFRPLRQRRYNRYLASGFLKMEAYELSGIRYSEAPYLRRMIRDRLNIRKSFDSQADALGWSKTRRDDEWRAVVRHEYIDHHWVRERQIPLIGRTAYKASPWEMVKEYRQRAIDAGEYHPPKTRRIRRIGDKIYIHIYKGDVQAQKARAKAKREATRGTPEYDRYLRQRREQKARAKERQRFMETHG